MRRIYSAIAALDRLDHRELGDPPLTDWAHEHWPSGPRMVHLEMARERRAWYSRLWGLSQGFFAPFAAVFRWRRPMPRMTELEENTFRTLCSRFREEQPLQFIECLLECLLIRVEDNSITAYRHKDNEGQIVDGLLVVFKGTKPAAWAEDSLIELQARIKQLQEEEGE